MLKWWSSGTLSNTCKVLYERHIAECAPLPVVMVALALQVSLQLVQLHNYIKSVVRQACEVALTREGFVPDPVEEEEDQGGAMALLQ